MDTLGLIESYSIASGVYLTDLALKSAQVELLRAGSICSGRYLIYIMGDRESVKNSVQKAEESGHRLRDSYVVSNLSPLVLDALKFKIKAERGDAIAVVESKNVSSGINAVDKAVKKSLVKILRLVTGNGINGKSYFVLGGKLEDVEEAVSAAKDELGKNLIEAVTIPRPDISVLKAL